MSILVVNAKGSRGGFTIVELLIVVVVIAILAAVVLIAYNGITQRATTSDLQSSLKTAGTKIEAYKVLNNETYPISLSAAGVPTKGGVEVDFKNDPVDKTFCLSYKKASEQYFVSNLHSVPVSGRCPPSTQTLIAGSDTLTGHVDSPTGANARFDGFIYGLTIGPSGNIYVGEGSGSGDQYVRIVTPAGATTTLANLGGVGTVVALTVAADGTVYAATMSGTIYRITSGGTISSFATGVSVASYSQMLMDNTGTLYLSATWDNRILRISTAGAVSVLAGTGADGLTDNPVGTSATFGEPKGMAWGSDGAMYVSDGNAGEYRIRRVTTAGATTTTSFRGSNAASCRVSPIRLCPPSAGPAYMFGAEGVAFDSKGYLYLGHSWGTISRISPDNTVSSVLGNAPDGNPVYPNPIAGFSFPWEMVFDGSDAMYIARNYAIYRIN